MIYLSSSAGLLLLISGAELTFGLLGIVLLLFLSGLVSGSEVAFFSLTSGDYEELEQQNNATSRRLLRFREYPRRLLATILIANNFINIAIVLLSDFLLQKIFPRSLFEQWAAGIQRWFPFLRNTQEANIADGIGFLITVLGVTFLLVLFGEVAPKIYARYHRVQLASQLSGPISALMRFFYPVSMLLIRGTGIIERLLQNRQQDVAAASREDIGEAIELTVINSAENGDDSRQDFDILKRIVKFSDVTVKQIMRGRLDVTSVDQQINYHELLEVVRDSGYSRIPVYEDDFDNVKGILYAKDLLGYLHQPADYRWNELVRTEVLFVPENKKISDLLREFQFEKMHMAIVINEFGGTEGLVTLEDIMEEVIGDIHDEFDDEQEIIYQKVDDLNFIFDGKTLLNDVCRIVKIPTDTFEVVKGESESFAGLILEMLGAFPDPEQEITFGPYRFKVISVNQRRVEEILITLPEPDLVED